MLTLALAFWAVNLLIVLFLFVCVLLVLTVLIQRPMGGGLSGAFGSGAGSGQTAFGAKTGDALTIATIIMFGLFLLTAVGLNIAARPGPAKPQVPASAPAPQPGPADALPGTTDEPTAPAEPAAEPESTAPAPEPTHQPAPQSDQPEPEQSAGPTPAQPPSEPDPSAPPATGPGR